MTDPGQPPTSRAAARAAKEVLRERLAGDPRVNGVGIARSKGRYAVRVNIVDESDVPELPDEVEGIEVRIVVVGRLRPLDE